MNYLFLRALKLNLRSEELKRKLFEWGEQKLTSLKNIDLNEKNKKRSNHERSRFFGDLIKMHNELNEVAKKLQFLPFFNYKGA